MKYLFVLLALSFYLPIHAKSATYDSFQKAMNNWVKGVSGKEKVRREKIAEGLNEVMIDHNFNDQGVTFSQFQRFLKKPYKPNLRDIYYVLTIASQVAVKQTDVAAICTFANIKPIAADALDLILSGLFDKIANASLSPLDIALFKAEANWMTGNSAKKITINDFLQLVESDPEQDCDSIFRNLDPAGVAALQKVIVNAVPTWSRPVLGYDSFTKNLTAWINFKYTDKASKDVAQKEIGSKVLKMMGEWKENQVPFPEFQKELLKTDPIWGGPLVYFSLAKDSTDESDNLPVPTDAVEAIYRCAGLDILDAQPNTIDRIYTALLSHQNGGTPGDQLTSDDVDFYENIIQYISTHQGKTVAAVKAYISSLMSSLSDYAKADVLSIIDPEHNPRPYNYAEDTEYFRNDQKLLPLHTDDPQYYREHVIPSLGVGKYNGSDSVGRYRYVSGKGGEMYVTVHYNQFLQVDELAAAAKKPGGLTTQDISDYINIYTNPKSPSYDPFFYKEIEDLAQISGVTAWYLLNDPSDQVLTQVTNVFLTIAANPPPPITSKIASAKEDIRAKVFHLLTR